MRLSSSELWSIRRPEIATRGRFTVQNKYVYIYFVRNESLIVLLRCAYSLKISRALFALHRIPKGMFNCSMGGQIIRTFEASIGKFARVSL